MCVHPREGVCNCVYVSFLLCVCFVIWSLPFLAFLLGHVVTPGRSDVSAHLQSVTRRVVDELETVATEKNASKPPGNDNNHVFHV